MTSIIDIMLRKTLVLVNPVEIVAHSKHFEHERTRKKAGQATETRSPYFQSGDRLDVSEWSAQLRSHWKLFHMILINMV